MAAMRDTMWNHRVTAILEKPPAIPILPASGGPSATARVVEYLWQEGEWQPFERHRDRVSQLLSGAQR
jgi:hypothetical protein